MVDFYELLDPLACVEKHRRFGGVLSLAKMERLQDSLAATDSEISFTLSFGKEGRIATVTGTVTTELSLICQRCGQAMMWPIQRQIKLGIVTLLDEAERLPVVYEPLLLDEDQQISIGALIEDELLLALPIVARHDDCGIPLASAEKSCLDAEEKVNPFAVLKQLQKNL